MAVFAKLSPSCEAGARHWLVRGQGPRPREWRLLSPAPASPSPSLAKTPEEAITEGRAEVCGAGVGNRETLKINQKIVMDTHHGVMDILLKLLVLIRF